MSNTLAKSSLMEPQDSLKFESGLESIPLRYDNHNENGTDHSFLLMDSEENLCTQEQFCKKLDCADDVKIKVVSIFGNTGDGKSHTMNHVFFKGNPVFETSAEQNSCTIGVKAAMQHEMGVLCLDTEGLLGVTIKENQRNRMLLKILAISDVIIYRTRSERLHRDMFEFLGNASKAFSQYFSKALEKISETEIAKTLGPAVIIFHETQNTNPLKSSVAESTEDKLRHGFEELKLDVKAFSSMLYVGVKTPTGQRTDFSEISHKVKSAIEDTTRRSSRLPVIIYTAMRALNLKFSGKIAQESINPFPEQYFTCTAQCESCNRRCQRSMGHINDGEDHMNHLRCNYQHQYENKVLLCKKCHKNGEEVIVTINAQVQNENIFYGLAKCAWKGSVIECPHCGEIYRSRQYWYGNKSPEEEAIRSEIVHVWKGGNFTAKGSHSAQMVLNGVTTISETILSNIAQPKKALTDWVADKVAPSYWIPNNRIINCEACKKNFEKTGLLKHHCRGCGKGFCHACSQFEMQVPARGWMQPVRVCNDCRQELQKDPNAAPENATEHLTHTNSNNIAGIQTTEEPDVLVRKCGETIYNTITGVTAVVYDYTKDVIKDNARPTYWAPDAESPNCHNCKKLFGTAEELDKAQTAVQAANANVYKPIAGDCRRHHCRKCGEAVCEECSKTRQPVPERGWQNYVRVCDSCALIKTDKHKAE